MKDVGKRAPAAVAGEEGFLGFACFAAFVLDQAQRADRGDIVAGLFLQPALPDPVGFVYPEVARRRRGRRLRGEVESEVTDGGRLFACDSAHSCVASSHAAG